MRIVTVFLLFCISSAVGFAETPDHPQSLSGFLAPGTYLGVQSSAESDRLHATIYSEEEFAMAIDARRMPLAELAAKHESVAQGRDQAIADYIASLEDGAASFDPEADYQPGADIFVNRRESMCRVLHRGDDYILVGSGDDLKKRRVFAVRFIATVSWFDGFRYSISMSRDSRPVDRTDR